MTIERVTQAIEKLELIDPLDEYAYEKAFLTFLSIKSVPVIVFPFREGIEVFRTRTHDDDILYEDFKEILNPGPHMVKNFARCNRPFQSKFYGSENRPTSYMELVNYWVKQKKVGDHLFTTIGRWLIKCAVQTLIITTPDPEKRVSKFDLYHGANYDTIIKEFDEETQEACKIFYRYLFGKFRKPAKDDPLVYIITTAYCNVSLAPNDTAIDAICYPSVPYMEQGINFAFSSKFVQPDKMELLSVLRNKFEVYLTEENKLGFGDIEELNAQGISNKHKKIYW